MEHSVRELAYKLWQIRSIRGGTQSSDGDWYDAEKILSNHYLKPGVMISYNDEIYSFLKTNDDRTILIQADNKIIQVPIGDVIVVDVEDT